MVNALAAVNAALRPIAAVNLPTTVAGSAAKIRRQRQLSRLRPKHRVFRLDCFRRRQHSVWREQCHPYGHPERQCGNAHCDGDRFQRSGRHRERRLWRERCEHHGAGVRRH